MKAEDAWPIIQTCGASDGWREDFLHHWPECGEYRFQGYLGFGGKIYAQGDAVWVSCYREDETPERLALIAVANDALAALTASGSSQ